MKYRYYVVTAIVAVAQYDMEDVCDEHSHLVDIGSRTALDAVELLNDGDDYLLELEETELHLVPRPRVTVKDGGQGPLLPNRKRS
jgi:hypothetical protein